MIVLSLFDKTTNMVKPWAEGGYGCQCVDIQHDPPDGLFRHSLPEPGEIHKIGADMRDFLPAREPIKILFAFPPCTDVAVSGARWFRDKGLGGLIEALQLFYAAVKLAEWAGAPYMIENPVSAVSSYWREPDYTFHPWQYGDLYTKKTCLWCGNGFVMPEPIYTSPPDGTDNRIHTMSPGPERADKRSETPLGFARAVYEANKNPHRLV